MDRDEILARVEAIRNAKHPWRDLYAARDLEDEVDQLREHVKGLCDLIEALVGPAPAPSEPETVAPAPTSKPFNPKSCARCGGSRRGRRNRTIADSLCKRCEKELDDQELASKIPPAPSKAELAAIADAFRYPTEEDKARAAAFAVGVSRDTLDTEID